MRITLRSVSRDPEPPRAIAVARGTTLAPLVRRPLDFDARRPPQGRLRAPLDVPACSRIIIRGRAVITR